MRRARSLSQAPAPRGVGDEVEHTSPGTMKAALARRARSTGDETFEGAAEVPVALELRMYREMVRARRLDERLTALQRQGRVAFHVGQRGEEAAIVGAAAALREQDWLVPCYREFAALLYRGAPLSAYLDQMFGNADDPAHGRQMPDHFHSRAHRCLSVSAPIGTQIPHAVGLAYAARRKGRDEVAMTFFGDGATSSNDFHSALNFAGVWRAPVVFACRNNGYAISLPTARQTASPTIAEKAVAYGIRGERVDGNDVCAVYRAARAAVDAASRGEGATLLELVTYRMGAHSTSDDPRIYRTEEEVRAAEADDPIPRTRAHLLDAGVWSDEDEATLVASVDDEIRAAIEAAESKPRAALDTLFGDVYAERPWHLTPPEVPSSDPSDPSPGSSS